MAQKFKPMLAPNEELEGKTVEDKAKTLPLPLIASYKIDGIRCIFKDGNMYSRSLKDIPNEKLHERFALLKRFSKDNNVVLDGELYAHSIPFNELSGVCRRLSSELPEDLKFYCFDMMDSTAEGLLCNEPFRGRAEKVVTLQDQVGSEYYEPVAQAIIETPEGIVAYFNAAVEWGCDGLILRHPEGKYKFGRGTLKEGLIYKLKPYTTFDAKIIEVVQGTEVDPNAKKKINELGYSETSKKKGDRIPVDKACDFVVMHEGEKRLKVMIAMTDVEKREVWKNRDSYIGRWIEYKGLLVGAKELPRHPVFLRFRDDKE